MYHHVVEMAQKSIHKFLQVVKNTKCRAVMNPHRESKLNCLKGQTSLSRTVKLQTLANACQSQAGENSVDQKFRGELI